MFSKAREARTSTRDKSEEELIKLEVMASWDEQGNLNPNILATNLGNIQGVTDVSGSGFPKTVTFESGNSYKVSSNGEVTKTNDGGGGETLQPGETATGGNKTYSDGTSNTNNTAVIPEGWTVSKINTETTVESGLVIYDLNGATLSDSDLSADTNTNGILDVQENYNQFVWVPVPTFSEFVRHNFGNQSIADSDFINTEPTDDKYYEPTADGVANTTEVEKMYKSVKDNGGFYIARYEAGNVWEWTMEAYRTGRRVNSGGGYLASGSSSSVTYRIGDSPNESNGFTGFRPALFV